MVDDSRPILDMAATMLKLNGYHPLLASTGIEALKQVSLVKPDLILLDVVLPDMDGFKICQQIKRNPVTAAVPIFMVSATKTSMDEDRGKKSGAAEYVTKPFRAAELADLIKSYIGAGNE